MVLLEMTTAHDSCKYNEQVGKCVSLYLTNLNIYKHNRETYLLIYKINQTVILHTSILWICENTNVLSETRFKQAVEILKSLSIRIFRYAHFTAIYVRYTFLWLLMRVTM